MPKPAAPYRDSEDLPRPPPSYETAAAPAGSSSSPLLGEAHSADDIPDDFKYDVYQSCANPGMVSA